MSRQDPCSGLDVQTGIIQQILMAPDNAGGAQPGDMGGVNLHHAVIAAEDFSGFFIPVMVDGAGIQLALYGRYRP